MRTVLAILLLCFLSAPSIGQGHGTDELAQDSTPVKTIELVGETPQSPVPKLEGTVEVSFKIQENGTVEIVNISANNPELIKYVVNKLKKITLDPTDQEIGKTVKYRFFFKKQT
jgi:hypothetical protein